MLPPGRYVLTGRARQPGVFHIDPTEPGDQGRNGFILASYKHRSVTLSVVLLFSCTVPFPVLFAHPGRQTGSPHSSHGISKLPSSCTSSASLSKSVEVGATSQCQLPPLQALQGIKTRRKDKGESGEEPPVVRELEDAWLSAGKGKYTNWPLCLTHSDIN